MDIRMKLEKFLFDFDTLNEEAKEELDNGRDEPDELLESDEQVSADASA